MVIDHAHTCGHMYVYIAKIQIKAEKLFREQPLNS